MKTYELFRGFKGLRATPDLCWDTPSYIFLLPFAYPHNKNPLFRRSTYWDYIDHPSTTSSLSPTTTTIPSHDDDTVWDYSSHTSTRPWDKTLLDVDVVNVSDCHVPIMASLSPSTWYCPLRREPDAVGLFSRISVIMSIIFSFNTVIRNEPRVSSLHYLHGNVFLTNMYINSWHWWRWNYNSIHPTLKGTGGKV